MTLFYVVAVRIVLFFSIHSLGVELCLILLYFT